MHAFWNKSQRETADNFGKSDNLPIPFSRHLHSDHLTKREYFGVFYVFFPLKTIQNLRDIRAGELN